MKRFLSLALFFLASPADAQQWAPVEAAPPSDEGPRVTATSSKDCAS